MRTEFASAPSGLIVLGCALLLGQAGCDSASVTSAPATEAPPADREPPDPQREGFEREVAAAYDAVAPRPQRTRRFELRAAPATVPLFDGRGVEVWAYNGQVPGPVLRVRLGEEVEVTFRNELSQPTTVHWHGVRVPNAMDGVPGVTQPPVPPAPCVRIVAASD